MFGGLELKGAGQSEGEDDNKKLSTNVMSSAFGFMNATTTTVDATSAPVATSSAFSFLSTTSSEVSEPAPVASSGFSFLQQTIAPAPVTIAPEPAPLETSSGFDFLIPSPNAQQDAGRGLYASEEPGQESSNPPPATMSAFSFLSATTSASAITESLEPTIPPAAPPSYSVSSASSVVSAPSPTPPVNVMEPSSSAFGSTLPTGAGITFGSASAKPVVRKKKARAQKIGMAGAPSNAPLQLPPVASTAPVAAEDTPKVPSPKETRDAAVEAQRRAEEFMHQKSIEEAKTGHTPEDGGTYGAPSYDDTPEVQLSPSSDSVVAEAKRAAEEAIKMQQASSQQKGGFMGTFFKGFGGSNSNLGAKGRSSSHHRASPPTAASTEGVDRLSQKQHEMKRAAAEREMSYQQQQKSATSSNITDDGNDDDDEDVILSTSAGDFSPVTLSATQPTIASVSSALPSFERPKATKSKPEPIVVRELPPTPKKKKTATETFEEYQALFAQQVHRAMEQVENVRSQQKMLLEERFVSLAKERLATQQIAQTEAQLQVAVEGEDYELADQLGQVLDGHKREKAEVAMMLESITKGMAQLESQKALVVQSVASCFENLAVRLTELREKEAARDHVNDAESLKQFALISKQLSAEQERLQHDLKHLERDEMLVAEERKELEHAISEQSGEYEKQRDSVKDQLQKIDEEIAELRKQIEVKLSIAAGLRSDMYGLEDSISRVRVKFARQLNRVDKKERSLQENRLDWENEQMSFKRQKEAHELQVQSHSEALLAHDALMKTLETELKLSKDFAKIVPTKLGFMHEESKAEVAEGDEAEGDLAQLQADVVKCEAAVSEAKILLKAATAVIAKLESEHADLIAKIPQYEAQKKEAAAKRDFKVAGKFSKVIKDATARLKECEEELLGEAAERKKAAEEELKKFDAELAKAREVAQEMEKISGQTKMVALAKKIEQLIITKRNLCGETTSDENTVRGVGAFVLEGQIMALADEGEHLGSKYGGWHELMAGIFGEKEPSKEDAKPEVEETSEKEAESSASAPSSPPVDDGLTSEERIAKVKGLIKRIQEAEDALEAAAAREDFDEAAELQEVFEFLQSELENVNLTEEESAIAFADDEEPPPATTTTEESEGEKPSSQEETAVAQAPQNSEPEAAEQEIETIELHENSVEDTKHEIPTENGHNPLENGEFKLKDAEVEPESPDAIKINGAEKLGKVDGNADESVPLE